MTRAEVLEDYRRALIAALLGKRTWSGAELSQTLTIAQAAERLTYGGTIKETLDALTDDEVATFAQRCRAHPTAGYFDVKLVRAALRKLFQEAT